MNINSISITPNKSSTPLISVAMPVYNGEQHLAEAIDSILVQSFTNFELIIIDDGSTDSSIKILKAYEKLDTRIRLITRENRNLATTLNNIIDLASGKWLARMDQDDIALPQRIERQLVWLEKTDADICGSWVQFFGTSDKRILKHAQSDEAIKVELLFCCAFAHPSVMMKTELVKNLRYDKAWEKCEDYDLWARAACAGWKMTNIPEVLLMYRLHPAQISSSATSQQQLLTQKIRHRYWLFVFDKLSLNKECIKEVLKLREPMPLLTNMEVVDDTFDKLLQINDGEAREVIFDHMTRLYYRAAANSKNAVKRWSKLNKKYGTKFGLIVKIQISLLSVFGVTTSKKMFTKLKSFYFHHLNQ